MLNLSFSMCCRTCIDDLDLLNDSPFPCFLSATDAKVFYADENDGRLYDEHLLRKQELRELKMLQKAEQKQFQDLTNKAQVARDQQDRRFEQETTGLLRGYDTELDTLTRSQKQQVERAEQQQESDLRLSSKKIRTEQVLFSSDLSHHSTVLPITID